MISELHLLPINVSCDILGVWLTLKSVVSLDSAFCNHSKRCNLLLLFACKEFVQHDPVVLTKVALLGWLAKRLISVSNVKFGPETVSSYDLITYISVFHDGIRCVHFFCVQNITEIMFLLASFCTKIKIMRCTDVEMSAAFYALLLHNPNIKEIRAQNVFCLAEFPLLVRYPLQDLQILSITSVACLLSFPWPLLTNRSSLQRLEFVRIQCKHLCEHFLRVSKKTTKLHSLSFRGSQLTEPDVICMLSNCFNLIHLDLSHNALLTDKCVLEVGFYLRSLRTLNIQHCSGLTDSSLSHIAEHCGNRLEMLYTNVQRPTDSTTEQIVKKFSEKCTALCYIDVHCDTPLCSGSCAYSLIIGCPALHTLVVNRICATTCQLSALLRPELKILSDTTAYDVFMLPI